MHHLCVRHFCSSSIFFEVFAWLSEDHKTSIESAVIAMEKFVYNKERDSPNLGFFADIRTCDCASERKKQVMEDCLFGIVNPSLRFGSTTTLIHTYLFHTQKWHFNWIVFYAPPKSLNFTSAQRSFLIIVLSLFYNLIN